MLSAVLEHGRILIRETTLMQNEPTMMIHYWPTRFGRQVLVNPFATEHDKTEDIQVERDGHYGYLLRFPGCGFWSESPLQGDQKAMRVDTEPYPCPKVRKGIETRYHYGRWEKYLKSSKRGWIPV